MQDDMGDYDYYMGFNDMILFLMALILTATIIYMLYNEPNHKHKSPARFGVVPAGLPVAHATPVGRME